MCKSPRSTDPIEITGNNVSKYISISIWKQIWRCRLSEIRLESPKLKPSLSLTSGLSLSPSLTRGSDPLTNLTWGMHSNQFWLAERCSIDFKIQLLILAQATQDNIQSSSRLSLVHFSRAKFSKPMHSIISRTNQLWISIDEKLSIIYMFVRVKGNEIASVYQNFQSIKRLVRFLSSGKLWHLTWWASAMSCSPLLPLGIGTLDTSSVWLPWISLRRLVRTIAINIPKCFVLSPELM